MKMLMFKLMEAALDTSGENGGGAATGAGTQAGEGTTSAGTQAGEGTTSAGTQAGEGTTGAGTQAGEETKQDGGGEDKGGEKPRHPKNLMDDDTKADGAEAGAVETPDDEAVQAFTQGIKAIDLGDGVTFDDEALQAMRAPLMELCGNDPKKAEGLVKAYTGYRLAEMRLAQERDEAFNDGLVAEAEKRFGKDLQQMVKLAKAGGERIFGDELWRQMRSVPQFANNPDIIEKLAAFGKSAVDDKGAVRKEGSPVTQERDWRERMYGGKQ